MLGAKILPNISDKNNTNETEQWKDALNKVIESHEDAESKLFFCWDI